MSGFSAIDLSQLAAPDVVEQIDYESILDALKADLIARAPELSDVLDLESEPLTKLLEVCAYRETIIRARVNDASRAVMLAYATGSDLDHLAAFFGVVRALVTPADPDATPPVEAVYETDARLRARTQLALEGYTTAGPVGAYVFHALSASAQVADVAVVSPEPGEVLVTVLSSEGDGTADSTLLSTVTAALNADEVRPLTDQVTVQSATIVEYTVSAELTFYEGPDPATVLDQASAALSAYISTHHRLGHDITRSGLFAALHQAGVQNVTLSAPAADLVVDSDEAAYCTGITITDGGTDL